MTLAFLAVLSVLFHTGINWTGSLRRCAQLPTGILRIYVRWGADGVGAQWERGWVGEVHWVVPGFVLLGVGLCCVSSSGFRIGWPWFWNQGGVAVGSCDDVFFRFLPLQFENRWYPLAAVLGYCLGVAEIVCGWG